MPQSSNIRNPRKFVEGYLKWIREYQSPEYRSRSPHHMIRLPFENEYFNHFWAYSQLNPPRDPKSLFRSPSRVHQWIKHSAWSSCWGEAQVRAEWWRDNDGSKCGHTLCKVAWRSVGWALEKSLETQPLRLHEQNQTHNDWERLYQSGSET